MHGNGRYYFAPCTCHETMIVYKAVTGEWGGAYEGWATGHAGSAGPCACSMLFKRSVRAFLLKMHSNIPLRGTARTGASQHTKMQGCAASPERRLGGARLGASSASSSDRFPYDSVTEWHTARGLIVERDGVCAMCLIYEFCH